MIFMIIRTRKVLSDAITFQFFFAKFAKFAKQKCWDIDHYEISFLQTVYAPKPMFLKTVLKKNTIEIVFSNKWNFSCCFQLLSSIKDILFVCFCRVEIYWYVENMKLNPNLLAVNKFRIIFLFIVHGTIEGQFSFLDI